jgi:hypothetical protein
LVIYLMIVFCFSPKFSAFLDHLDPNRWKVTWWSMQPLRWKSKARQPSCRPWKVISIFRESWVIENTSVDQFYV